jgi:hypothetical protein
MTMPNAKPCARCGHSSDDHRMLNGNDPVDPATPFRCIIPACTCPDFRHRLGDQP